jgi:phosphoribosylpyrophosphate synthetase
MRKGNLKEIVIKEGNPKDKDVVIIDDLIQS